MGASLSQIKETKLAIYFLATINHIMTIKLWSCSKNHWIIGLTLFISVMNGF